MRITRRGFTLIELSMVLVIVGLIIGGYMDFIKSKKENQLISQAKMDVITAKDTIIGNAIKNSNTLPDEPFFQENLSPVKLNQHELLYIHDKDLEDTNMCAFESTRLSIKKPGGVISDVAFLVVNESSNKNMQTKEIVGAGGEIVVEMYDFITKIDNNIDPINIVENYDDIVEWTTLAQLQKTLHCENSQLKILNQSMPSIDVSNINLYSAKIVVDGNFSVPTDNSCSFNPSNGFSYYNYIISNNGSGVSGTVEVLCTVTENGGTPNERIASKRFVITVNDFSGAIGSPPPLVPGSSNNGNNGNNGNKGGR